jgi:hypothetical protein
MVKADASAVTDPYWAVELRATPEVFLDIFDGVLSLGDAFYAGLLSAPEEKSKHNLVVAIGRAVRAHQEARLRARRRSTPEQGRRER